LKQPSGFWVFQTFEKKISFISGLFLRIRPGVKFALLPTGGLGKFFLHEHGKKA
jgi:hypothetical protein|tara:strand:- start:287 stop:448 length:162 start_codon:yes stop_codon:yes gene_type:complete